MQVRIYKTGQNDLDNKFIDEKGAVFSDVESFIQPNEYGVIATEGFSELSGILHYMKLITKCGNDIQWRNLSLTNGGNTPNNLGMGFDDLFYVFNELPKGVANTFDGKNLNSLFGSTEKFAYYLPYGVFNNQILPVLDYRGYVQSQYDYFFNMATKIVERYEDAVELGHATLQEKALWGQWKTYRAILRTLNLDDVPFIPWPKLPQATTPEEIHA